MLKFHFNHFGTVPDTFVALEATTANITDVAIGTEAVFQGAVQQLVGEVLHSNKGEGRFSRRGTRTRRRKTLRDVGRFF